MRRNLKAQQVVEYLLVFSAVVLVIFAASRGIGNKVENVLNESMAAGLKENG